MDRLSEELYDSIKVNLGQKQGQYNSKFDLSVALKVALNKFEETHFPLEGAVIGNNMSLYRKVAGSKEGKKLLKDLSVESVKETIQKRGNKRYEKTYNRVGLLHIS